MFESLPHTFAGLTAIAEIRAAHDGLAPGESSGARYRVAGRVLGRRGQGKVIFCDIHDRSGVLQGMGSVDALASEAFARLGSVSIGDIVGVEGELIRTRRGELSLALDGYELLVPCQRPLPDTYHGLASTETRYRQRYLDLLMSAESRDLFITRARIVTAVRRFLDERGFVEVETPVLQPIYGGANARPFVTHHNELGRDLYLRVATELYLKRLIVGGLERVYEIGKDFRNEGVSFKHMPEFTMLETYEAYVDYDGVMAMTEAMVAAAALSARGTLSFERDGVPLDLTPPWKRIPLGEAIKAACGVDPVLEERDPERLRAILHEAGVDTSRDADYASLVDHLLSHFVEPHITDPVFLTDYPVELSPFARRRKDRPEITERFEAFCAGMEIGNGFTELNDPADQKARFEQQVEMGRGGNEEAHPMDLDYVTALEYGLPPTGGLGLGIDRVVMLLTDASSIREVVLFPAMRDVR